MSWKPCRGNRVQLDKAVKDRHECYFEFWQENDFVKKCKLAFKWMKAEKYLSGSYSFYMLGEEFIDECKANKKTYKPLLKMLIENN